MSLTEEVSLRFDRGTLVVRCDRATAERLPGVSWDPRVERFRAPAHRYHEMVESLAQSGVSFLDHIAAALFQPETTSWVPFELRPYQAAALEAFLQAGARGLVVLPTGSGKTRVALAAIREARVPALCLVPTLALLEQWCTQLEAAQIGPVGRLGGGRRNIESLTVSTFESAYRQMGTLGRTFGLLVIDEVHHFGVGVRDEALEMSVAPKRLGLTATLPKSEAQIERLARLVGPVVYQRRIAELVGEYLAPLSVVRVRLALSSEEHLRYRAHHEVFDAFRRQHPGMAWAEMAQLAAKSPGGRKALNAWRALRRLLAYTEGKRDRLGELLARHASRRVLVFCADNTAAYAIAKDHLLMPITCDIAKAERQEALASFARGELRGLVSARVLNEGIDLPEADVAIVVSAALGELEHVQRVGRILRPRDGKEAILYELVADRTVEVGWAKRRSGGLDPGRQLRLHPARRGDLPAILAAK